MIGSNADGKMTVGQELMKITGLKLFHNHMTIEPVLEIFGDYNLAAITRLRQVIFQEFARTDNYGMIFTYVWDFDQQSDWVAEVKRYPYMGKTVRQEGRGISAGTKNVLIRHFSWNIRIMPLGPVRKKKL